MKKKKGLTGQLPDKCVQLYELGDKVFFLKKRECAQVSLPWRNVKYIGFGQYAATLTEEQFEVNLSWTPLKFQ